MEIEPRVQYLQRCAVLSRHLAALPDKMRIGPRPFATAASKGSAEYQLERGLLSGVIHAAFLMQVRVLPITKSFFKIWQSAIDNPNMHRILRRIWTKADYSKIAHPAVRIITFFTRV